MYIYMYRSGEINDYNNKKQNQNLLMPFQKLPEIQQRSKFLMDRVGKNLQNNFLICMISNNVLPMSKVCWND